MTGAPSISVIIPCWNVGLYLHETLSSVAAQSWADFEVLMVDDGSTDGTLAIMRDWEARDARFVALALQGNRGVVAARNAALARARGEFVALLDGDDLWIPDALAMRVGLARRHPRADVITTDFAWMEDKVPSQAVGRIGLGPRARAAFADAFATGIPQLLEEPFDVVASTHFVWTGASLIRRSAMDAVGRFHPGFNGPEDTLLWLRLADRGAFVFAPIVSAFYRQRAGSLMATLKGPKELHYLDVLNWLRNDVAFDRHRALIDALAGECHNIATLHFRRHGDGRRARSHALAAIRRAPLKWSYWRELAANWVQVFRRR